MTTNKPEVVKYIVPKHEAWDVRTLVSPKLPSEQLMVLASDYEALQTEYRILESELATVKKVAYGNVDLLDECEKLQAESKRLRAAMIEAKSYIEHYMYGGSSYREPAAKAVALIDAAMQGVTHDNQLAKTDKGEPPHEPI